MSKDWNRAYSEGNTPWDKGYASPPLRAFLKTYRLEGRVLVPGCGAGYDVRLLAEQGASVLGLDIAPLALEKARSVPTASYENYALADFLNLPKNYHDQFDAVVEHTCLCALDPADREAYVRSAQQALKPGGRFLAVFFRAVSDDTREGPPHPISSDEIEALFAKDFEMLERTIPEETYSSRPVGSEEVCLMRKKI
ncbi:MAG: SAM-dependent methyltransferase [Lentimonas sp.]|jgi:SAM-dependent methyltransferase